MWNGTADTLNANPTTSRPRAASGEREAVRPPRERARDGGEPRRARGAVGHRHAEQEERRGERPEQEVLHRALDRAEPRAEAGQDVERQRQDLERQEDDDEVGGDGDQGHPRRREQDERIELAARLARPPEVVEPVHEPQGGRRQQDQPDDDAEPVDGDRAGEHGEPAVPVPQRDRGGGGPRHAGERDEQERQRLDLAQHGAADEHEDPGPDEEQLGDDRAEVDGRRPHGASPFETCDPCASSIPAGGRYSGWISARRPPGRPAWSISTVDTHATSPSVVGLMRSSTIFG